jgi:hypothetical protein
MKVRFAGISLITQWATIGPQAARSVSEVTTIRAYLQAL